MRILGTSAPGSTALAARCTGFAADPANLPKWASGLGTSVELVDGQWIAEYPMGRVSLAFAPPNEYGILDH